mmetsp:Transcript_21861/g.46133  ORF Transcript_21861/g.46133 Transcript_21861/m.46133 type:complete len:276 (-) Transcript_21861:278-1105(-)
MTTTNNHYSIFPHCPLPISLAGTILELSTRQCLSRRRHFREVVLGCYQPRRGANRRVSRWDVLVDQGLRADHRPVSNLDIAQYRGLAGQKDAPPDLRVPVVVLGGSGGTERNVVHQVHVVTDHGRLADHHARSVVHGDPLSPFRGGVDVNSELVRQVGLERRRDPLVTGVPVAMCHPRALHGVESLEEEVNFQQTAFLGRRIHDQKTIEVGRGRFEDGGIVRDDLRCHGVVFHVRHQVQLGTDRRTQAVFEGSVRQDSFLEEFFQAKPGVSTVPF